MKYTIFSCAFWLLLACGPVLGLSNHERQSAFKNLVQRDLSLIPPDLVTWIDSQAIQLDKYDQKVSKLNVTKILSKVRKAAKHVKKPATVGLLPEHVWKNFHTGHIPYDETRALRNIDGFYVSATDMLLPEQEYIVSQMPSEETEDIFWQAVVKANVRTMVALVTPSSKAYWDDSRFPRKVNGWKIEKVDEKKEAHSPFFHSQRLIRRLFKVTSGYSGEERIVTHFHYENWADHDAPEHALFCTLLTSVDKANPSSSNPILVHCAAGIGRSGTFVAAHSLRKEIMALRPKDGPHYVNIPRRILEMRMQRGRMLTRPPQVTAVIEAVREAIHTSYTK